MQSRGIGILKNVHIVSLNLSDSRHNQSHVIKQADKDGRCLDGTGTQTECVSECLQVFSFKNSFNVCKWLKKEVPQLRS